MEVARVPFCCQSFKIRRFRDMVEDGLDDQSLMAQSCRSIEARWLKWGVERRVVRRDNERRSWVAPLLRDLAME
jgi:hypothetical protein